MTEATALVVPDSRSRADACPHPAKTYLGRDGSAAFHRCRECGAVLIEDGGRLYWLRPTLAAAQATRRAKGATHSADALSR